jgi:hypothetical protein
MQQMESTPPAITSQQLTQWAESLLRINHLNTLVQREIAANSLARATDLSERARKRAWTILNEMFAAGAAKPEGYCEPGTIPKAIDDEA